MERVGEPCAEEVLVSEICEPLTIKIVLKVLKRKGVIENGSIIETGIFSNEWEGNEWMGSGAACKATRENLFMVIAYKIRINECIWSAPQGQLCCEERTDD
jgi:hypothetical protein